MKRNSFVFYRSFYEAIQDLPTEDRLEIYDMIMEYGLNGNVLENCTAVGRAVFKLIKPQLEANNKRYLNGKKGGNPNFEKGKSNPYYFDQNFKQKDNQKITETLPKDNREITTTLPNVNVNDNVNVNVNVNDIISTDYNKENNTTSSIKKENKEFSFEKNKKNENDYEKIKDLWNSICTSMPRVNTLSPIRKNKIKLRINENGLKEKDWAEKEKFFTEVFTKMQNNDYFSGNNNLNWKADIDWIFRNDNNIIKVLEGNYNWAKNRKKNSNEKNRSRQYTNEDYWKT